MPPARSTPWFLRADRARSSPPKTVVKAHGLPTRRRGVVAAEAHGLFRRQAGEAERAGRSRGRGSCATRAGVRPVYKRIDTVARRSSVQTPYMYSSICRHVGAHRANARRAHGSRRKAMILGGGPNRIGQGIEFDYCCVHACLRAEEIGIETIMVNCNPETVSTDYDTSDRLYFEPLTAEDGARDRCERSNSNGELVGVIVQLGGQTPLKLAHILLAGRHPDPGHPPRRHRPGRGPRALPEAAASSLNLQASPPNGLARSREQAVEVADADRLSRSSSAPPMCWAAGRWRSSTIMPAWNAISSRRSRSRTATRC